MRDLVIQNEQAEFANDVQLGWYPSDARNYHLAKGYIFTSKAIDPQHTASTEILEIIRKAFILEEKDNRFVVIATYGHGKSHLALALANFFGKTADTPEVECLLQGIEHALNDPPVAQSYREFKDERSPYLILRLRGDQSQGLHQQVMQGLETALREQEATKDAHLKFWFDPAEKFLTSLTSEQVEKAKEFLAKDRMDIPLLLQKVQDRDGAVYSQCRSLFQHIYGFLPDFGGEVSLQEAIEKTVDEYCGDDRPFSGLLILFDEFSAFVQKYAQLHAGGSLQDLLNGVENKRGRAVFLAFSQHQPEDAAAIYYRRTGNDDGKDDLGKELDRLPKTQRYLLYSSMETVLDSYLQQSHELWDELLEHPDVLKPVADATNLAMQLFAERYSDDMGWDEESVQETITKGCFPLHPLTTAILCASELNASTDNRTVLGFILDAVKKKQDEPAIKDGILNWVYPTALVDYFHEMLAARESEYDQYLATCQQIGPEAPDIQQAVLKAMLLHMIARLKASRLGYERIISHLCGYPLEQCQQALQELYEHQYISFDEYRRVYTFWQVGHSGYEIDKKLREEITGLDLDWSLLCKINEWTKAKHRDRLRLIPVSGSWEGHADDWGAEQKFILPRFTAEHIRSVVRKFRIVSKGIDDAPRGYVLWPLVRSDADIDWLKANAESVLDEALQGDQNPCPVVVALPDEPRPDLRFLMLKEYTLAGWDFTEQQKYGSYAIDQTRKKIGDDIDKELEELRSVTDFVVPQPYRAGVQSLLQAKTVTPTPSLVIRQCYDCAYRYRLPFLSQSSSSSSQLRTAVKYIAQYLARNSISENLQAIQSGGQAENIMRTFLRSGSPKPWGFLSTDGRIQPPTVSKTEEAWNLLERVLAPGKGEVSLQEALLPLLNPPFGYDYNQLMLLFCAWYGYNRHDLHLSDGKNLLPSLDEYFTTKMKPREFIEEICHQLRISRRDRDETTREVAQIIDRINNGTFTMIEADMAHSKFRDFISDERSDPNLKHNAEQAMKSLEEARKKSLDYKKQADQIDNAISLCKDMNGLAKLLRDIERLPILTCVTSESPGPAELRSRLNQRIAQHVDRECQALSQLSNLTAFEHQLAKLKDIKIILPNTDHPGLHDKVDEAIRQLQCRKEELEEKQKDNLILASLEGLPVEGALSQLRSDMDRLQSFQPNANETKGAIQKKITTIEKAISQATKWVRDLSDRLDAVANWQQAKDLLAEIHRRHDTYLKTPEIDLVEDAIVRCEVLERYCRNVTEIGRAEFHSPNDVKSLMIALEEQKKAAESHLSEQQIAFIDDACAFIQQRVELKVQQALQWLIEHEKEAVDPKEPDKLLRELNHPPAFLPDETRTKLTELQQQVQQQIDRDATLSVVLHFRKIADRQKRQECLQMLEQIAEEMDNT